MQPNILVQAMGESHNLEILGFFLERPFHAFSQTTIHEFLGISRDTVRKHIQDFESKKILIRHGRRGPYKLNRDHPIISVYEEFMDRLGDAILKFEHPDIYALGERSLHKVQEPMDLQEFASSEIIAECISAKRVCSIAAG